MEELDIKNIWKTANKNKTVMKKYSLADIKLYKEKKSKQLSKSSRLVILFDIAYKFLALLELSFLLIFLNYQYPFQTIIGFLLAIICVLVFFEGRFLKKINLIKDTDSVIENLQKKLSFMKTTYRKFIFIGALSNPLFVGSSIFLFYYFKYNEIRIGTPLEDPILYLFLIAAYLISLFGQWPFYKIQIKELLENIEDIEDTQIASVKIEEAKKRKRNILIISSLLILIGILIFLIILMK